MSMSIAVLPCQIPTVLEKSSACMLQSCWAVLLQKSPLELSLDRTTTENSTALMPLSIPLTISFPVFPHFSVAVSWLWTVNSFLYCYSLLVQSPSLWAPSPWLQWICQCTQVIGNMNTAIKPKLLEIFVSQGVQNLNLAPATNFSIGLQLCKSFV